MLQPRCGWFDTPVAVRVFGVFRGSFLPRHQRLALALIPV
jgi:hypothetical protein